MKSGVKTAVSLLITVVVFVGFTLAASLGMFSSIEKSFYEPAKIKTVRSSLDQIAVCSNEYIISLLKATGPSYGGFMSEADVGTFVSQKPSDKILKSWYSLQERFPELEGIRVIDANGRRVHYSSFKSDSKLNGQKRIFSYYSDVKTPYGTDELDYSLINATVKNESADPEVVMENPWKKGRFAFDFNGQRIVLSYPMESDDEEYTVAFYYNLQGLKNLLAAKSLISLNEMVLLISDENCATGGLAFNVSKMNGSVIAPYFMDFWKRNINGPEGVFIKNPQKPPIMTQSEDEIGEESQITQNVNNRLVEDKPDFLFVADSENKILRVGGLYDTGLLTLPDYVRILLLVSAFITVCLLVLILICFRKDDEVVIKNKVKRFQLELLNEYFGQDINRAQIAGKLQASKDELSRRIKKDLGRRGKRHSAEVDAMLEHSWNDIISALVGNGSEGAAAAIDMVQLKNMFQEVISSGTLKIQSVQQPSAHIVQPPVSTSAVESKPAMVMQPVEEAQPIEDAEELEEVEEIEEAQAIEDAEELEEVEEIEEAQPIEDTEELEEVEEIEEAQPIEDAEELEEVEEIEEVQPIENAEELEEVEEIEEVQPIEDAEEIEEVEEIEEAQAIEDAEELEEVEELEEAQPIEDADHAPGVSKFDVYIGTEPLQFGLPTKKEEPGQMTEPADDDFEISSPVSDFIIGTVFADNRENLPSDNSLEGSEELSFGEPLHENLTDDGKSEIQVVSPEKEIMESLGQDEMSKAQELTDAEQEHKVVEEVIEPEEIEHEEEIEQVEDADFEELMESEDSESADLLNADDAKPLDAIKNNINNSSQFMFTAFAANNNNITDLPPDVIVADENGVFSITSDADDALMPPSDVSFKELVDSVLR